MARARRSARGMASVRAGLAGGAQQERDLGQGERRALFLGEVLVEAVGAEHHAFDQALGDGRQLGLRADETERRQQGQAPGARVVGEAGGAAGEGAQGGDGDAGAFAQAQQGEAGGRAGGRGWPGRATGPIWP